MVTYDNNDVVKKDENERGYFNAVDYEDVPVRRATVTVYERDTGIDPNDFLKSFEDNNAIKITACDVNGNAIVQEDGTPYTTADGKPVFGEKGQLLDAGTMIVYNKSKVDNTDINDSSTTFTIEYTWDGNYTFDIGYTDKAGNVGTVEYDVKAATPKAFTIDRVAPTGTVSVSNTVNTWTNDTLLPAITFARWSKDTVKISGTSSDVISVMEDIEYYITGSAEAMTAEQLDGVAEEDWKLLTSETKVDPSRRFTVYLRLRDYAGNTSYINSHGIIVDATAPEFLPALENLAPEVIIAPVQKDTNGIFNSSVTFAVTVKDPEVDKAYSGLNIVKYSVKNLQKETQADVLYKFDITKEDIKYTDLKQVYDNKAAFTVDADLNNSNYVSVTVYAMDNAGNETTKTMNIKIDVTKPIIDVLYNNNNGDTAFEGADETVYFNATRKATIVITERNFNNKDKVEVTYTGPSDASKPVLVWKDTAPTLDNSDDFKHTAEIIYDKEGQYTFNISYTDEAGNVAAVDYNGALAPNDFVIDTKAPEVTVTFNNNSAVGNYYNKQRVATVTVKEANFETTRIVLTSTANDNGTTLPAPALSTWNHNGDIHTATISYNADAHYTLDFEYTDKAGNKGNDVKTENFFVDTTAPTLEITGVQDEKAYNDEGKIGIVITAKDTNFDVFNPVVTGILMKDGKFETVTLTDGQLSNTANGKVYTIDNIDTDGYYTVKCSVVDKAGNVCREVVLWKDGTSYKESHPGTENIIEFSVNRNGSVYTMDDTTKDVVKQYYVQEVTEDVVLIETNVEPLQEYTVTLNDKVLKEGTDYSVELSNNDGDWAKYTYKINKSLFGDEGEYKLVVSSKDKANNNAFSDVKNAAINFIVDRTAPVVTVTGMESNGRYQGTKQTVTLIPTDDGGMIKDLIVRIVDSDNNVVRELLNLSGEALTDALEANEGIITFDIPEGMRQNVQIICSDNATNGDGNTNVYEEVFTNVSVSSSKLMILWANPAVRYSVIAAAVVVAGIIVFVILKKKGKKKA